MGADGEDIEGLGLNILVFFMIFSEALFAIMYMLLKVLSKQRLHSSHPKIIVWGSLNFPWANMGKDFNQVIIGLGMLRGSIGTFNVHVG